MGVKQTKEEKMATRVWVNRKKARDPQTGESYVSVLRNTQQPQLAFVVRRDGPYTDYLVTDGQRYGYVNWVGRDPTTGTGGFYVNGVWSPNWTDAAAMALDTNP
jgi:hypothetical protein